MNHNNVPVDVTYFREYGIHPVNGGNYDPDYIASFPTWDETFDALRSNLPKKGNIITPEYTAAPEDLSTIKQNAPLIDERIRRTKDLTKRSDALVHLGTPTHSVDSRGRTQWFNSVLSIRRGAIESQVHKQTLVPAERTLGINTPPNGARLVKNGNAVLICAELFLYTSDPNNNLKRQNPQQIFAPTMWATPAVEEFNLKAIDKAGSEDVYYREQLERAVGSYLMRDLPSVQRVIVSDRGRSNLAPYNAVFDRTR